MKYAHTVRAVFLERPNRFIAIVDIQGKRESVHVKNTGRCKELLVPGAEVILEKSDNPARKTAYDLICVYKGERLINMDSAAPNQAAAEWIRNGGLFPEKVKVITEKTFGNSRFDIYAESEKRKAFIEVKGVTLEENGIVRFPDAPTIRGVKHVEELIRCLEEGYEAYLLLVVQMEKVLRFEPNWKTHKAFGQALVKAQQAGVRIMARECFVKPDEMNISREVPVFLEEISE